MKYQEHIAIADLSISAIGEGRSLSPYVAKCLNVFTQAGLRTNIHALGTNIEGPLPKVLSCIETCHNILHEDGVARIISNIRLTTRTDRMQSIEEKINAVSSKVTP